MVVRLQGGWWSCCWWSCCYEGGDHVVTAWWSCCWEGGDHEVTVWWTGCREGGGQVAGRVVVMKLQCGGQVVSMVRVLENGIIFQGEWHITPVMVIVLERTLMLFQIQFGCGTSLPRFASYTNIADDNLCNISSKS